MKGCPQCQRIYSDETLNFCRVDGAQLSATLPLEDSPTRLIEFPKDQDASFRTTAFRSAGLTPPTSIEKTAPMRPSVAVLPFTPLEAGGGDEYLGLGMADSLITKLSGINRITVRPTSAIRKYADVGRDSVDAGREQRVDAVLEGSIQRAGQRIRVTARLVDVRDGKSLWGYQSDRESGDIFDMEDSITEQIVSSLVKNLSYKEETLLTKRYTHNVGAFHLYLKGRYYWNKFTEHALEKAIECFNQALEKDPAYALAYWGLADCYGVLGVNYLAPKESFPKAKVAVLSALQIDDTLSEAHTTLGALKLFYDWDLSAAEKELKHAIDLNNSSASGYQLYAYYHHVIVRPDVAITLLEKSLELDPLSLILNADLGWAYVFAREYNQAVEQGLKTLEMDPNFAMAHLVIGMAHEHKGQHKKAIKELTKAVKLSNESPRILAWLGYAYANDGSTSKAEEVLARLIRRSEKRHIDPYNIAVVHIGLQEKERVFESLGHAYDERSGQLIFLKVDPVMDNVRSDSRFTELVGRLHL